MEVQLGDSFVDCGEIRKSDLTEFVSNPSNIYLTKLLESVSKSLLDNILSALDEKDADNAYALKSYRQAVIDITELIKSGISKSIKEDDNN